MVLFQTLAFLCLLLVTCEHIVSCCHLLFILLTIKQILLETPFKNKRMTSLLIFQLQTVLTFHKKHSNTTL